MKRRKNRGGEIVRNLLLKHFRPLKPEALVVATRVFPSTARVDLQCCLDRLAHSPSVPMKLLGVHSQYNHETLSFAHLSVDGPYAPTVGPIQYDELEVGETTPARVLKNGLWLCRDAQEPFAVLVTQDIHYGRSNGVCLSIAVGPGVEGVESSIRFLDQIEKAVAAAGSYRGKVLSLETSNNYSGKSSGIKVHRLSPVAREDVILPKKTLELLERNVTQFVEQRDRLRKLRMPLKKGLLFYGPPGTGKTHTIRYLASQMANHTTLLITADQVALLDDYVQLARFLQPALVVIEDADLIARSRENMRGPCEESLLNRLLNEMDGLREDATILFILTTNAPEALESALAGRPGRIDQAIEFPLPDDLGRRKLIRLYARGLEMSEGVAKLIVRKTRGASAAFIKELMRRSAQYLVQENKTHGLLLHHVESALDEMLFSGGSLNVKLLGGAIGKPRRAPAS